MGESIRAWGTEKELEWLETIGDHIDKNLANYINEPKIKYLKGYIASCKNRVDWGDIKDKKACIKMAKEMLRKLQNGY